MTHPILARLSVRGILSRDAIPLGRLFGIPLRLHYTWFIIFALVTVSLSWQYFPMFYPDWPVFLYWIIGVATSLLFFASVVAHELAHSLVSNANGVPVRSITLFIFGGVAQISREATRPIAELLMAAAGPVSSLLIAALFGLVWLLTRSVNEPVAALGEWLLRINVSLALFNLIPGFPLDGGRILRSLVWRFTGNYKKATRIATLAGQVISYLFIFGGIALMFLTRDWFNGLWIAFIGFFLGNAASASYRQVRLRESSQGYTARHVMSTDYPYIPGSLTLGELAKNYILPSGRRFFLVVDSDHRLEGIITLKNIKAVPSARWDITLVHQAMTPRGSLMAATPEADLLSLLELMDEQDINQMPVVQDDRVIGIVTRGDLVRFIQTHSELRS